MKPISINKWPGGDGGMVQVAGTSEEAKLAIKILAKFGCHETGFTVLGSSGERIYTYRVTADIWKEVRARLEAIYDELQGSLF